MGYFDVSKCIDDLAPQYLEFLKNICDIKSNSHNKDGVNKVADFIIDYESANVYSTERVSFGHAGDCVCIDYICDQQKPMFVFSAHMDTALDSTDVVTKIDNEFIHGIGACDCKGGIAVALLTMAALKKCCFSDANIRLILQSDEEVSSCLSNKKTVKYICEKSKDCKAFFNLEGKYPGSLTVKRAGIITVRFTVTGKSAHASKKEQGINAINEAAYKIVEIQNSHLNDTIAFNCGVIGGGVASNVIPGACSFDVEARVNTKADYDKVLQFFGELAEKQYIKGAKTEFEIISDRLPMEETKQNLDLLEKISFISEKYGFGKINPRQSLGGSDAAYTTDAGIPTADGLGIVGHNLHSKNEKAEIGSLSDSARLLAAIVMELS